jgi:hypothetical protein
MDNLITSFRLQGLVHPQAQQGPQLRGPLLRILRPQLGVKGSLLRTLQPPLGVKGPLLRTPRPLLGDKGPLLGALRPLLGVKGPPQGILRSLLGVLGLFGPLKTILKLSTRILQPLPGPQVILDTFSKTMGSVSRVLDRLLTP